MSFTDQKQRTATEADCKAKWGCGKPGERFRCFLCGHKFVPGDLWRWVYAGDLGFTNFMVCDNCDGDDVRERWRERNQEYMSDRYWALRRSNHE